MKFKFFIASAILIFTINACKQLGTTKHIPLINPAATEKLVKLFNFIQDIQGEYTLSGQHNFVGKGSDYSDQLEEITGKKARYNRLFLWILSKTGPSLGRWPRDNQR